MNNDASGRTIWESKIKQNMVPLKVDGSQSTYVLDDKKNSAVEIHFGTRYLIPPRQLSTVEPAVAKETLSQLHQGTPFNPFRTLSR